MIALPSLTAAMGIAMAYLAYSARLVDPLAAGSIHVTGSAIFWLSVTYLVLGVALRGATTIALRGLRTPLGASVFVTYLAAHYFAYALALALIVRAFAGFREYPDVTGVAIFVPLYEPIDPSLGALAPLLNLALSPQLVIWIRGFVFPMTPFGIATGLIISFVVLAVVAAVLKLGRDLQRRTRRIAVAAPLIGVTAGAMCCATLPLFIASSVPAIAYTLLSSPIAPIIAYVTYFAFPPTTTAALAYLFKAVVSCPLDRSSNNPGHGNHGYDRHDASHQ